jgi:hypothetical protein
MRILLDESLPRKVTLELPGHDAQTVQKRCWSGLKNGALLREASQEFQVREPVRSFVCEAYHVN